MFEKPNWDGELNMALGHAPTLPQTCCALPMMAWLSSPLYRAISCHPHDSLLPSPVGKQVYLASGPPSSQPSSVLGSKWAGLSSWLVPLGYIYTDGKCSKSNILRVLELHPHPGWAKECEGKAQSERDK